MGRVTVSGETRHNVSQKHLHAFSFRERTGLTRVLSHSLIFSLPGLGGCIDSLAYALQPEVRSSSSMPWVFVASRIAFASCTSTEILGVVQCCCDRGNTDEAFERQFQHLCRWPFDSRSRNCAVFNAAQDSPACRQQRQHWPQHRTFNRAASDGRLCSICVQH